MLMLFGSALRCTTPTGTSSTIITRPTLEISGRCPGMSKFAFLPKVLQCYLQSLHKLLFLSCSKGMKMEKLASQPSV